MFKEYILKKKALGTLTYLIDAEHGLDLLLSTNQCTTFTPQLVQHLKGSLGPLTAAFFKS